MKQYIIYTVLAFLHLNIIVSGQTAQINTPAGATVPFNSNASYAFGIMPTNLPTAGTYTKSQDAANAYSTWVTNYVRSCGGSPVQYRVLFDDGSSTVSEGIGYGMLIAAYAADKTMFDGFYAYYKANSNGNGLMNWKIGGCSGTSGSNGATDADEDAAMALVVAACQWPSATSPYTYKTEATNLITAINKCEIDTKTTPANQVSNGDGWINCNASGNTCRNPSYVGPGYYRQFAAYVPALATSWNNVVTAGYTMLNANRNTVTGLVSSWCDQNGAMNNCNGTGETYYGYDACRNPWRMATDYIWYGTAAASANFCSPIANFVNGVGAAAIKGPVTQAGGAAGTQAHNATFVSTFAAGIVGSSSTYQTIMNSMYTQTVSTTDALPAYFGNTLRVISLFVQTGNFWKPCPSSMPVSLINFNAISEQSDVLLSWTTGSEQNNSYFAIERSSNGVNFTSIGTVAGSGTSSEAKNYQFRDLNPMEGTSYYRLQQFNFDGSSQLSNTVDVNSTQLKVIVAPNPFENEITISVSPCTNDIYVKVIDVTGRTVFEEKNFTCGNSIKLQDNLPAGIYFVNILSNNELSVTKMIKK